MLVSLDLTAAFGSVNHKLLLNELQNLGITGSALKWFTSYLEGRTYQVSTTEISDSYNLDEGVPQGGILSPIAYIIYGAGIIKILEHHKVEHEAYADDNQLYLSFTLENFTFIVDKVNMIMNEIKQWTLNMFLKLNQAKTQIIIFGRNHNIQILKQLHPNIILLNETNVINKKVTSLGFILDNTLTLEPQINNIVKNCSYYLFKLWKIRKYLTIKTTRILTTSLIFSRIDMFLPLYFNLPHYLIRKLQIIQNNCIRLIFNIPKNRHHHITPYLHKLNWLPIKAKIEMNSIIIAHKTYHKSNPKYLKQLLTVKPQSTYNLRRNNKLILNQYYPKTKIGHRAFSHYAPKLLNSLPNEIFNIRDYTIFKKHIHNYFWINVHT